MKSAAPKAKKSKTPPKAKGKASKPKQASASAATKPLGKSVRRLAKNSLRTLPAALPLKGKSKPAKKK